MGIKLISSEYFVYKNEQHLPFSPAQKTPDIVIKSGDRSIAAHRFTLAAKIPYFRKLLSSEEQNNNVTELVFNEFDPIIVEAVIDYC